jgi:hypothetical protein
VKSCLVICNDVLIGMRTRMEKTVSAGGYDSIKCQIRSLPKASNRRRENRAESCFDSTVVEVNRTLSIGEKKS